MKSILELLGWKKQKTMVKPLRTLVEEVDAKVDNLTELIAMMNEHGQQETGAVPESPDTTGFEPFEEFEPFVETGE